MPPPRLPRPSALLLQSRGSYSSLLSLSLPLFLTLSLPCSAAWSSSSPSRLKGRRILWEAECFLSSFLVSRSSCARLFFCLDQPSFVLLLYLFLLLPHPPPRRNPPSPDFVRASSSSSLVLLFFVRSTKRERQRRGESRMAQESLRVSYPRRCVLAHTKPYPTRFFETRKFRVSSLLSRFSLEFSCTTILPRVATRRSLRRDFVTFLFSRTNFANWRLIILGGTSSFALTCHSPC